MLLSILNEASYKDNIGFIELLDFYKKASKKEIQNIEKIIKNEDWEGYKKEIKRVLGVDLK